ncbi:MAG: M56 family metallopeptidase, partial [bacterium]
MWYGLVPFGVAIILNSTILLGVGMLAYRICGRASASLKHLILVGSFAGILVLPVLLVVLPTWTLPEMPQADILGRIKQAIVESGTDEPITGEDDRAAGTRDGNPGPAVHGSSPGGDRAGGHEHLSPFLRALRWYLPFVVIILWGIGALTVLIIQIVRWAGAGFIAQMAVEVGDGPQRRTLERIRWELGIARPVGLLRSGMPAVAFVWGIVRSYIVLPAGSLDWSDETLEAVLRHELAHVKRCDNMIHLLAVFACALYWFNPLVWAAMRRLHFEREVACDNTVINAGTVASGYAKHLMEISVRLNGPRNRQIIPAVMAHSSDVKRRLLMVLNTNTNRKPLKLAAACGTLALVILLAFPVAAFRPWAEVRESRRDASAAIRVSESADVDVGSERKRVSLRLNRDGRRRPPRGDRATWRIKGTVRLGNGDAEIVNATLTSLDQDLEIKGKKAILDADAPLGCRFEKKGHLVVIKKADGRILKFRAEPGKKKESQIRLSFYIDGKEQELDEARRREFRDVMEKALILVSHNRKKAVRDEPVDMDDTGISIGRSDEDEEEWEDDDESDIMDILEYISNEVHRIEDRY